MSRRTPESSPSGGESLEEATATGPSPAPQRGGGARWVAAGMLSSRVFGLMREVAYSRFLGTSFHADVLRQAMKAPNLLQNLLGDQTMSAAFIPVYSRLLEKGREQDAARFAGAVFGFLVVIVFSAVVLGMLLAPWLVALLSPGFLKDAELVAAGLQEVDRYALQVRAVRFIFPMTGFIVLAAWAMGILNSHRRFFLPYLAPAFWNVAIITAVVSSAVGSGFIDQPALAPTDTVTRWLFAICGGALVGGLLQFAVQVPLVIRLCPGLRPSLSRRVHGLKEAASAFVPAVAGRGIVQVSLYVDGVLATFLAAGAPGVISYASTLLNLPLAAFGMSVAAAELPELSRQGRDEEPAKRRATLERIERALRQSTFLIVPSVVGYLTFGFLVVGLLYRGGKFGAASQWLVWAVLASYTVGLLASAISRLLQNVFFAVGDTRTPARIAAIRLASSLTVGIGLMLWLDAYSVEAITGAPVGEMPLFFGACGLALGASVGAWGEMALLLWALRRRVSDLRLPFARILSFFAAAAVSAAPAIALWFVIKDGPRVAVSISVLGVYALCYLGQAYWRGLPELELWIGRFKRRR
ncbi:MAG: murein biosynthesis integral membrane protein MurJ [Acidobacteriota bacterium]